MAAKTYRVLLIDPKQRTVEEKKVVEPILPHLHALVNADTLDFFRLADHGNTLDQGVVDDGGLARGEAIHAFKFDNKADPIAGRCLIIGATKFGGDTFDAKISVAFAVEHIEWLGLIKPKVLWVHDARGSVAKVTYEVIS
jgi:hypothetical protein